ncbi:hypothetical protein P280DRAFT_523054 [Massarina eburnea CBS 473.64]|uniref:Uncharacterized protein n=1 Tax=Massarina eburnea CBS 473.64 TaxID=1395130 RepID=A0A6A6RJ15_9PLEO|nr:hypothetical protein P280DRAFT_523054 [Massarina eburnea CBS 473.64]
MAKSTSQTRQRRHRAVGNVFGWGSPHADLPFPGTQCRLTAAEIVAYLPHWLRSVDIIDRFVMNGVRSSTLSVMANEFRHQPHTTPINANSMCSVLQTSMRKSGYEGWTVGRHVELTREGVKGEWDETVLDVANFRTLRLTHADEEYILKNRQREAIEFRQLALHVKKHPEGFDALDLARCVQHAAAHPDQSWLFPDDYFFLLSCLGGPAQVNVDHIDRKIFNRYDPTRSVAHILRHDSPVDNLPTIIKTPPHPNGKIMAPRRQRTAATAKTGPFTDASTPKKQGSHLDDIAGSNEVGSTPGHSMRRSGRLASKPMLDLRDDTFDALTPVKQQKIGFNPLSHKRKLAADYDDDFQQDGETSESSVFQPGVDVASSPSKADDDLSDSLFEATPIKRPAAKKARQAIQDISKQYIPKGPVPETIQAPSAPIDPGLMQAATWHGKFLPKFLQPPVLSRDRLTVDEHSVWLYSADGCTTMAERWESALSSSRFNGPRSSPPFRELYRLTDPPSWDISDWAENIRWAKQQHRVYGSQTWTEYDYHLELIKAERTSTLWISDETILGACAAARQ